MKPFDLDAFKHGDVAITRGGEEAHFVYHDPLATPSQRLGYRIGSLVFQVHEDGREFPDADRISSSDLLGMKPKTREVEIWLNVYDASPHKANGYSTYEEADAHGAIDRLGDRAHRVILQIEE